MRKTYRLHRTQWVSRPLAEVFAFFSNARNLESITPPWLRFEILPGVPDPLTRGAAIRYRLHWHGLPIHWTTQIARWEPPHEFEDLQVTGPYSLWRHVHQFAEEGVGTRLSDTVNYALPFGWIGQLAHALAVRRNIEQIFDFRQTRIREMFGSPAGERP